MAEPKDESKVSTLPDPELNPLLNPLLAAHMGRWAEVYFTSPPEKRTQAVADLLRELESNFPPERLPAEKGDSVAGRVEDRPEPGPTRDALAAVDEPALACAACGHRNSADQIFCGMCGRSLIAPRANSPQPVVQQPVVEEAPLAQAAWDDLDAPLQVIVGKPDPELDHESVAGSESRTREGYWPGLQPSLRSLEALSDDRSEPVSRTRIFAGVVLAILLGVLVYMAWRSSSALRSSAPAPTALPREAPSGHESEPATPAGPSAVAPTQPNAGDNAGPTSAPATRDQGQPRAKSREDRRNAVRPAPQVVPVTASSFTNPAEGNGSEELALAEKNLNGGPGATRDSRQAALWLWKAVGKKNLTATLLLSDLYLRGDGVTKSCDQARLLLDAAARKGAPAAAERLRNLQAFGCQ